MRITFPAGFNLRVSPGKGFKVGMERSGQRQRFMAAASQCARPSREERIVPLEFLEDPRFLDVVRVFILDFPY